MIETMILRSIALAAMWLAVAQDSSDEIQRAILRLSNDDANVRAEAEAVLLKLGPKAIPALREASKTVGAVTRENAARILAEIERIEFEKTRDAENRKTAIPGNLNDDYFKKTYPFEVEGGRYKAVLLMDKAGSALSSVFFGYPTQFDFDIVSVIDKEGKVLRVDRCGICSPAWVFVHGSGPLRVKYAGTRRWFSKYEVTFENPLEGDEKRVGDFTITVKWPELELSSPRGFADDTLTRVATSFVVEHKDPAKDFIAGGGGGGRFGGRFKKQTSWCSCEGGPKPFAKPGPLPPVLRRIKYLYDGERALGKIEEIKSISLTFGKPIEEPFEVESPELPAASKAVGEK